MSSQPQALDTALGGKQGQDRNRFVKTKAQRRGTENIILSITKKMQRYIIFFITKNIV
jgi:hypothetical protein